METEPLLVAGECKLSAHNLKDNMADQISMDYTKPTQDILDVYLLSTLADAYACLDKKI
jgi:hypothetical protein